MFAFHRGRKCGWPDEDLTWVSHLKAANLCLSDDKNIGGAHQFSAFLSACRSTLLSLNFGCRSERSPKFGKLPNLISLVIKKDFFNYSLEKMEAPR